MRIAIVLNGRFPTDKAYGVTTGATYKELVKLGHEVFIYAFPNQTKIEVDSIFKVESFSEDFKSKFVRKLFSKNKRITSKILWKIYLMKYLEWVKGDISKKKIELLWIRDYNSIKITEELRIKTLLEIHQKLDKQKISRLNQIKDLLVLAPISKSLISNIEEFKGQKVFAPMGIGENFLTSKTEINKYCKSIKEKNKYTITYAGKLFPGGISKGTDVLIAILNIIVSSKNNFKLKIVGGDQKELFKLKRLFNYDYVKNYLELIGQVEHEKVIQYLKETDFIILPSSADPNYLGFPLKAIESCASGKIMLVEDCPTYRNIFADESVTLIWFSKSNLSQLFDEIGNVLRNDQLENLMLKNVHFAKEYVWANRIKKILSASGD